MAPAFISTYPLPPKKEPVLVVASSSTPLNPPTSKYPWPLESNLIVPPLSVVPLNVYPAIVPPVSNAFDAVTSPTELTLKLDDDITFVVAPGVNSNTPGFSNFVSVIPHPPILPALDDIVPSILALPLVSK